MKKNKKRLDRKETQCRRMNGDGKEKQSSPLHFWFEGAQQPFRASNKIKLSGMEKKKRGGRGLVDSYVLGRRNLDRTQIHIKCLIEKVPTLLK